ncbi:lysergyl peptide synthetase LpsB [Histoplasma ohiense]|nr:lysergyl peptide synthetase LpsB [Histoplasma ohiense (nom. inval.)]
MVLSPHPRCLFPVIEHHVPPRIGHGFFKTGADVRNTEHSRTLSFCAENSLSLLAFYKTVWALILKQFANTDHVYFGVVDTSHTTRGMPSAPGGEAQEQEHSKTQSWCHVHLSSTDTLLEILEQLESEPRRGYPAEGLGVSSLCFNTEIHLLEGDISDYTGGNDIYPCPGMIDIQLCISPDQFVCRCRASSMTGTAAQSLCETFRKTVASVLANPRQTVPGLDMLCSYDRSRIERWNKIDPWSRTVKGCIHDLIQIQVSCQPENLAADGWDGPMTFRELWDRSSRLSYYFHDLGVKQGIMVLFSMGLSKWAIIAMLAILRTGAVCVPIDLLDPTPYIRVIEAKLVFADQSQVEQLFGKVEYILTDLQNFVDLLGPTPDIYEPQVSPQDPAFVMFTSGITSTPKPVILGHEAICTNILHLAETLEINDKSRIFQCSSLTSNVSIFDIFGTIVKGGCVCYATEHDRDTDLPRAISATRTTHVLLTPALLRELTPDTVRSLEVISVISDGLAISDLLRWQDHVSLVHLYGNTECTICCTATDTRHQERLKYHGRLNIGRPIGCRTWIAEPSNVHHNLVPIGGVGELLIEGTNLAHGYYVSEAAEEGGDNGGNENMMTQPFIVDPEWLSKFPNIVPPGRKVRMYRTRDLVRYESDGSIKFMRRMEM